MVRSRLKFREMKTQQFRPVQYTNISVIRQLIIFCPNSFGCTALTGDIFGQIYKISPEDM